MPTYQYRCQECGLDFDKFQSIKEPPIDRCPSCGGKAKRLISGGAGFLFKGSGFYITDYRSAEYRNSAKLEKEAVSGKTAPAVSDKTATKRQSTD